MDTDGPGIDPYTKVIPSYMVITYASDYDSNKKISSDNYYEPEDDDEDAFG